MTPVLTVYLTLAAVLWPAFARYRYRKLKARHPHTHEQDVYRDAWTAVAQGAACAIVWWPWGVLHAALAVSPRLARAMLGRSIQRDLTRARTARLEAELAADRPLRVEP